jgi:hypothetical protein
VLNMDHVTYISAENRYLVALCGERRCGMAEYDSPERCEEALHHFLAGIHNLDTSVHHVVHLLSR